MIATIAALSTLGISGIYLEARTCSIFAGPCHFNGEVMTDGRGAVLALTIQRGGSLEGLSVAAAVISDRNLGLEGTRRSVVYIDSKATEEQAKGLVDLLRGRSGSGMGEIIAIRPATIELSVDGLVGDLAVSAGGDAVARVKTSGAECHACSMPGVLWYEPILKGATPSVATVQSQAFSDRVLGETWRRYEESAAFVGTFAL
jgi:hypothetical protein